MLNIEKVVKLLDDQHFNLFREYVKNISKRSYYPLALIDVIDRSIEKEQDSDDLCEMVYTENDEKTKKKFFQMVHYTFRLTSFLSKNYPNYLLSNITLYQKLINQGQINRANLLLETLIDVCEKIEDYPTLNLALQIKAQKEFLENNDNSLKTHKRVQAILKIENDYNEMYVEWRSFQKNLGKITKSSAKLETIDFLKPYFKHSSAKIKLLSKVLYQRGLYLIKSEQFFEPKTLKELEKTEKELKKNEFIVFPFFSDLQYKITYLKLYHRSHNLDENGILDTSSDILNNTTGVLFWKNFVNAPEIFSIAMQTSYYASRYMTPYKDNHYLSLPIDVKQRLEFLISKCEELIEQKNWDDKFAIWLINLKTIYTGLLLLCGKGSIRLAIRELEGVLISFQQLPFQNFIDPIFTNLIIGYFSLKDYEQVDTSYKRYRKITDKNVVNPENDLTIHGFYYASKWLETERKQYAKKFSKVLEQTDAPNLENTKKLLLEIVEYYKIPLA